MTAQFVASLIIVAMLAVAIRYTPDRAGRVAGALAAALLLALVWWP